MATSQRKNRTVRAHLGQPLIVRKIRIMPQGSAPTISSGCLNVAFVYPYHVTLQLPAPFG